MKSNSRKFGLVQVMKMPQFRQSLFFSRLSSKLPRPESYTPLAATGASAMIATNRQDGGAAVRVGSDPDEEEGSSSLLCAGELRMHVGLPRQMS